MKISVFTVMLPDLTPEEAAPALAAAGYDGAEWRVTHVPEEVKNQPPFFWGNNLCTLAPTEEDARRAKLLAEASGLSIPGLGTYINAGDMEATEQAMNFAKIAGAPQIRVGVGRVGQGSYPELFEASRKYLTDVEQLAKQTDVKALVEMHHGTITASASAAYRMVKAFDPDYIGVIYDAGNMVYEGFEEYQWGFEILGPYLAHVHLKNAAPVRPEEGGVWRVQWSPMADGMVDFPRMFDALAAVGYDGWLGIEDFSQAYPTQEALVENIKFVRNLIAQAQG